MNAGAPAPDDGAGRAARAAQPRSPARPRPRASLRVRVVLLALATLVCLGLAEATLQLLPGLLPGWYRERFPPHGIEFFEPGLLDRTPVDAVPLPYGALPYAGPPPHDLVDRGVAPAAAAARDRAHTPRLVLPVDRDGLPNGERRAQADLVLLGDSFLVYASQTEPAGLVATLGARLGATTLNLGVSGMGPLQERTLLRAVGLPARPRLVLWFFFGGNDVVDTQIVLDHRAAGRATWGDLLAARRAPRLVLPSLVAELFHTPTPERLVPEPLAGLPGVDAAHGEVWFHPDYLRFLAIGSQLTVASPGWREALAALRDAHAATVAAGARFLVVFVPSKEQVHLPHVRADDAALLRCAAMPGDAAAFAAAVRANRDVVERELTAACAAAGVPLWSCTPVLDELARAGESGYYAADTHWHARGQLAVAERLLAHLLGNGFWPR